MDKIKVVFFFSWLTSLFINRLKNPKNKSFKRILIIRLDEIGDMMTSMPAIHQLAKSFPTAEITVWCTRITSQLLIHTPYITKIVTEKKNLEGNYDLIVDLFGNNSTTFYALVHQPKYRFDRGSIRFKNKFMLPKHPHEINVNFQILKPLIGDFQENIEKHLYLGEENKKNAAYFLNQNNITRFAVLHPFSLKKLKEWPSKKFAELAILLRQNYQLEIIFIGTKKEEEDISSIQNKIPFKTFVFAGYNLLDLAALCSKAALMVGNDSGPMHIANAVNIPVIGLFGPGEPHLFAPTGKKATFIHYKLECNPCDQVHCVHPENTCMNRITIEDVLNKVDKLLNAV